MQGKRNKYLGREKLENSNHSYFQRGKERTMILEADAVKKRNIF